ncbi:MAG TPA: hypothetical protein VG826_14395 [Pirellulales bacterium]|nr:hypothetical protein [Pirellulales bacterium]
MLKRLLHVFALTAAILLAPTPRPEASLLAQSRDADAKVPDRSQRMAEMQQLAVALSFEEPDTTPPAKYLVAERPLLRFSDADRGIVDGTLWAYGGEGRPAALLEMYCGRYIPLGSYRHAWTATSDRPVKLLGAPGIQWTPRTSAVRWAALETNFTPAREPAARLSQFKSLAKRFSSFQIFNPGKQREELRLLVQPLHRYSDVKLHVADAAIFAFALGTNPEALLFLEAGDPSRGQSSWQFGMAQRGSSAEIHVLLDGQEVWTAQPLAKLKPEDPFCHFLRPVTGGPVLAAP